MFSYNINIALKISSKGSNWVQVSQTEQPTV